MVVGVKIDQAENVASVLQVGYRWRTLTWEQLPRWCRDLEEGSRAGHDGSNDPEEKELMGSDQ